LKEETFSLIPVSLSKEFTGAEIDTLGAVNCFTAGELLLLAAFFYWSQNNFVINT